jgi:DNA-binding MarR family transcriptional regulator
MADAATAREARSALDAAVRARRLFPRGGFEGLDPPGLQILLALCIRNGQSVRTLQEELFVTQSQVSHSIKRLLDGGLVTQQVDGVDGRVRRHAITRPGRALVQRYLRLIADV